MKARVGVLVAAVVVALVLVVLFVPAEFVAFKLRVPDGERHPTMVPPGPYWVPVWSLGPGELELPGHARPVTAKGRYVLIPLLLVGELCLVGALGGCVVLALVGGKRRRTPAA